MNAIVQLIFPGLWSSWTNDRKKDYINLEPMGTERTTIKNTKVSKFAIRIATVTSKRGVRNFSNEDRFHWSLFIFILGTVPRSISNNSIYKQPR